MTVLRHVLFEDDSHQTPVSIIFSYKCSKFFSGFVGGATQVVCKPYDVGVFSKCPLEEKASIYGGNPFHSCLAAFAVKLQQQRLQSQRLSSSRDYFPCSLHVSV